MAKTKLFVCAQWVQLFLTFVIMILIAYAVGLSIVFLVNRKLEQITIQLPNRWEKARPQLTNMDVWEHLTEAINSKNEKEYSDIVSFAQREKIRLQQEEKEKKENWIEEKDKKSMVLNKIADPVEIELESKNKVENFANGKNTGRLDPGYDVVEPNKNSYYTYKPINFPHPKTMSTSDFMTYSLKYHPHMTKQDYINWLVMFKEMVKDGENKLKEIGMMHYKNLEKVLNGESGGIKVPVYENTPSARVMLYDKGKGERSMHLSDPYLSYDINKLTGYNVGKYSEFI